MGVIGRRFGGLLAVGKKAEKFPTCHILDCRLNHPWVVYSRCGLLAQTIEQAG